MMTPQERDRQAKDFEEWKEEMDRIAEYIGPMGGG
jgi:hypothetical protein